jgi:multiple sugar transport system substrate-binding protein
VNGKRILLLVVPILALSLAACKAATPTEAPEPTPLPPTEAPAGQPTEAPDVKPTATELVCSPEGLELRITFPGRLGPGVPAAVEMVKEKYPGLEFALSDASSTYTDTLQQVVADAAAGVKPDVVMVGTAQVGFYVDNLGAQIIDPSYLPETYNQRFLVAGIVDGQLYAVPTQVSIPLIIWNKDIFAAAGLDPDTPPATFAEMEAFARQIKENVPDATPTFLATSIVYDWIFQNLVQSAGGQITDQNGNPAFNSKAGLLALEPYYILNRDGLGLGIAGLDGFGAFTEGVVGMALSSSSLMGRLTKGIGDAFEWGVAPMPVPEGGERRFAAGGNAWVILTDEPCRAQFASEFIAASVAPETQAAFSQVTGYIPVDKAALEMLADFYAENPNFAVSVNYEGELTSAVTFRGERAFEASEVFRTMLESVATGTQPSVALAEAEQEILSILGR